MWKKIFVLLLVSVPACFASAQIRKSFEVTNNQEFDKIKFSLNSTNGQCVIKPGELPALMNIVRISENGIDPQYEERIIERTKQVKIHLKDGNNSLGSSLSRSMFSKPSVDDYSWKVYLSNYKPMDIDLRYAVGDTYIDLSGLPIEKLKMNTGSANVRVNYDNNAANQLKMDTFMIKADMGTFSAKNLHLARSENVIANIGFGTMHLDFKHAEEITTLVTASVGAGKLEVILPSSDIPVKININDSPLCRIKIPDEFKETAPKEFTNSELKYINSNHLIFNVDVAVGNIVFISSR